VTDPPILHQLIVRHPSRRAILVENFADGPRLPSFAAEDRHTAEVDYINAAVLERWGLVTTVLRSLRHGAPDPGSGVVLRTHELEVHTADPRPPTGTQWRASEVITSLSAEDAGVASDWFEGERTQPQAIGDRAWTRPGWFAGARDWIDRQVRDRGGGSLREIVQLRSWASSCVLLARTTSGDLYFKALPATWHEWAVTEYLSRHFAESVPRLLATEAERRWLLMHGSPGGRLEDIGDARAWRRAAAMYGRLQVACVTRTDELRALGCPERGLERLSAAIELLSADDAALRTGTADGLSRAEVERFLALVPELQNRCAALAERVIPLTIEHGDLWPGNFLVTDSSCVLIDWEDAAVGHPFFSLAPLLVGLATYQPSLNTLDVRHALEDAYLAAFAPIGAPDTLRPALQLAAPLGFIDMALRYRSQSPSMVRLHPWMRDLAPQAVTLAIAAL
jgi:Phosphotransferase enzyme family